MSGMTHQAVREAVLARIRSGEWPLGARIPDETALAESFGCARTTVNRALRALAEDGLVERRRKGGTRVCQTPVRKASLAIPVLREQVEAEGHRYAHRLLERALRVPDAGIAARLGLKPGARALWLRSLHLASDAPFALEERWVNVEAVPAILDAPLDTISANEWLVQTVPVSSGDVAFGATNASAEEAELLGTEQGHALFTVARTTWHDGATITTARLLYHPGYQLHSQI